VRAPSIAVVAVLVAALAASAAGCKKSDATTSCDAVGARFLAIAEADLARDKGATKDEQTAVAGLVAPLRDALVKACRQDGWTVEARGCMAAASDEAQFRACEAKLTGTQRALLEQASAKGIQAKP